MPYNVRQSVMDALDACQKIQEYTQGHTLETYCQNSQRVDAVERRFEILGEAFNRIDDAEKPVFAHLYHLSFKNHFGFVITDKGFHSNSL